MVVFFQPPSRSSRPTFRTPSRPGAELAIFLPSNAKNAGKLTHDYQKCSGVGGTITLSSKSLDSRLSHTQQAQSAIDIAIGNGFHKSAETFRQGLCSPLAGQ
jgi:hypothetical protein